MRKKNNTLIMILALSLLSFIMTLIIYPYLPETIPTNFGFNGEITSYGSRNMIFITGILPLLLGGLFFVVPKIDPKRKAYLVHSKPYWIVALFITLLLIVLQWLTIGVGLGMTVSIERITPALIGILFIVIGNYMPQFRQNYTLGIKTPWTLDNEVNWKATHRFGGYVFIVMGIFMLTALFTTLHPILFFLTIFGGAFLCFGYSYWFYRNQQRNK